MKRLTEELAKNYRILSSEDGTLDTVKAVGFTLTYSDWFDEEGKEWEDVTYYGEAIEDPSGAIKKPEWIYILVNKHIPGICKIGMTTTSVRQRVDEINAATGVITPWYPVYSYKCVNSYYLEQEIHKHLQDRGYRLNPKREGFTIDSNTARTVVESLGSKYQVESINNNL